MILLDILWVGFTSLWWGQKCIPSGISRVYGFEDIGDRPRVSSRGLEPLTSVLSADEVSIRQLSWATSLSQGFPTLLSPCQDYSSPAGKLSRTSIVLCAWSSSAEPSEHLMLFQRSLFPLPDRRRRSEGRQSLLILMFSHCIRNRNKPSGLTLAKSSLASIQVGNWGS